MSESTMTGQDVYGGVDPKSQPPKLTEIGAFRDFMATGWSEPDRKPGLVPGAVDATRAHRDRLSAALPGRTLVIAAGVAPLRANDTYFDFRPHSEFAWLACASVEGAVLVLSPAGSGHDATLYLPSPAYPGETEFFASAQFGELWVGAAPSLADWSAALGVDVRPLDELDRALAGALRAGADDPRLGATPHSDELGRVLSELRMIKDDWEITQLRQAVDLTIGGFAAVTSEFPTAIGGAGERWLQGTFNRFARTHGNDVGYATIVGSGKHAPTLHWVRCDGPVRDGDAVLLDMGVEAKSLYTADVTRTFPASGTFTPIQRQVHDLVEKAHRAGLAEVAPGKPWTAFHHASMAVIAEGLHDWGLLPVSVAEALSPEGQQHRRGKLEHEAYHGATMAPGMVLTVEPGLYFHAHDQLVPPELRGIGVRIEQDILVTDSGSEILDAALPIDAAGLERWMSEVH
jgi:Xaa-Pro aminopeptidase